MTTTLQSGKVELELICQWCKRRVRLQVQAEDIHRYRDGALAQSAFPYLTPAEREMIISSTCNTCWDEMMI